MRGLFFKVFIIFWIAQSLIFVISTALIVRHHFESPEASIDTLNSSLASNAKLAVESWETGGCAAMKAYGWRIGQTIGLQDVSGQLLCGAANLGSVDISQGIPQRTTGRQVGQQYVWLVPAVSMSGKQYVFLLSRPHVPRNPSWPQDLLHFSFPQLPVAIVIGGFTTFALVLLFTNPVIRLRKAARELAQGKLNARVAWPRSQARIFAGDEVNALMHDFNHMAERLESLVGAQKMLLRDVSHELRSPLARLSVAMELAREEADEKTTTHLNRIERETERLNQLIGQLLSLSSMEAIEKIENFEPLSLHELIERMIPDAEYEAQQRLCRLVFEAEDECVIDGNEELLYRAIENVVRNAIRYTKSGSEVEIGLKMRFAHGRRQAEIEVSDRGPGIPDNQLSAIFRPFYRVDFARSPDTGGFGVGLAIADRAVRLHHGELSAQNREGGGTTIRIGIPAREPKGNGTPTGRAA
jgi:two-component system, OmpR family, sensor histidine kinase CpxA